MGRIFTLLFFLLPLCIYGQHGFRIAELNTENFFDCEHDSLKNDELFLPSSLKRWNYKRYWIKLQNIGKELTSISTDQSVDLIALTEIENDSVITYLTKKSVLRRAGYKYIMTQSDDPRGIDVALLYQESTFRIIEADTLKVDLSAAEDVQTRDILHVKGFAYTGDTLHIYVCHFSSKLGGEKVSEKKRIIEALTVKKHIQEVQKREIHPNIIILGDFNETPSEAAISSYLGAKQISSSDALCLDSLYNLSASYHSSNTIDGTYKYKESWEMIDQIIVSGTLLNVQKDFYTKAENLHIHSPKFILQPDEQYTGYKPFKTYNGYRYLGGFSDHLPIYLDFVTKP